MRTKLAGYAFDFMRMNRRMHNKSYIVDGAVTIIGGRNIGDEYFQVGDENYFLDLDVLSVGSVVAETAGVFDRYWNSASVFGVEQIIRGKGNLSAFGAGHRDRKRPGPQTGGAAGNQRGALSRWRRPAGIHPGRAGG